MFSSRHMINSSREPAGKKHHEGRRKSKLLDLKDRHHEEPEFVIRMITPRESVNEKDVALVETVHTDPHPPPEPNRRKSSEKSCCSLL